MRAVVRVALVEPAHGGPGQAGAEVDRLAAAALDDVRAVAHHGGVAAATCRTWNLFMVGLVEMGRHGCAAAAEPLFQRRQKTVCIRMRRLSADHFGEAGVGAGQLADLLETAAQGDQHVEIGFALVDQRAVGTGRFGMAAESDVHIADEAERMRVAGFDLQRTGDGRFESFDVLDVEMAMRQQHRQERILRRQPAGGLETGDGLFKAAHLELEVGQGLRKFAVRWKRGEGGAKDRLRGHPVFGGQGGFQILQVIFQWLGRAGGCGHFSDPDQFNILPAQAALQRRFPGSPTRLAGGKDAGLARGLAKSLPDGFGEQRGGDVLHAVLARMAAAPVAAVAVHRKRHRRGQRTVWHEAPEMPASQDHDVRHADSAGNVRSGGFRADIQAAAAEKSGGFAQ